MTSGDIPRKARRVNEQVLIQMKGWMTEVRLSDDNLFISVGEQVQFLSRVTNTGTATDV
jgi:hypothetical protein